MQNGICTKRYPKQYISETQTDQEVIHYTGVEVQEKVVAHWKKLSMGTAFDVEFCQYVKAIKYICKTVYNGSDQAIFEVNGDIAGGEVKQYQIGHYISSNEANIGICHP